jgi:hypothetical protein
MPTGSPSGILAPRGASASMIAGVSFSQSSSRLSGRVASSCVVDFLFSDVGLLLSTDCASQRVNEDGIE